jgi:dTMP kinase
MVRDMARGMSEEWLRNVYGIAMVPDAVFYLKVEPDTLLQRIFQKKFALDYWESGMDIGISRDMFDSFLKYQDRCSKLFEKLQIIYNFSIVDGNKPPQAINHILREKINSILSD